MLKVRIPFFLGDYQQVCQVAEEESKDASELLSLKFRALVLCGRTLEARQLLKKGNNDASFMTALKLYMDASRVRSTSDSQEWQAILENVNQARERERDERDGDWEQTAVLLSIILCWAGKLEEAYKVASQSDCLEAQLLIVMLLAMACRYDLAEKKLDAIKAVFGDDVAVQMVEADLSLRKGEEAAKTALYIYQELAQLNGPTVKLLNGQACANILLHRHAEAEENINQALELDPTDVHVLGNLLHLAAVKGESEQQINDVLARIAATKSASAYLMMLDRRAELFQQVAAKYSQN